MLSSICKTIESSFQLASTSHCVSEGNTMEGRMTPDNWNKFLEVFGIADNDIIQKMKGDDSQVFLIMKLTIDKMPWLNDYFKDAQFGRKDKSEKKACEFRSLGNEHYAKKDYDAALSAYNWAILYADCQPDHISADLLDGSELALAFANRSAVLFRKKKYKACLRDICYALSINYPDGQRVKLHIRAATCYLALKHKDEGIRKIDDAKISLPGVPQEKQAALQQAIDGAETSLQKLHCAKNSPTFLEAEKFQENALPDFRLGPSQELTGASAGLVITLDERKGRCLVSEASFNAGDIVIVEEPYVAVLLPHCYNSHCYHCFTTLESFFPCKTCRHVRYCTQECQLASWEQFHKWECKYMELLESVGIAHLTTRIILATGLDYLLGLKDEFPDLHPGDSVSIIDEAHNINKSYAWVFNLLTHIDKMDPTDLAQYSLTAALLLKMLEVQGFFSSLDPDVLPRVGGAVPLGGMNPIAISTTADRKILALKWIGSLLFRHVLQLVCNATAITEVQVNDSVHLAVALKEQIRVATAIYPVASMMNHSCDPNVVCSFHKGTMIMRLVKNLSAGEEFFNCYGPRSGRMLFHDRQKHLTQQYHFVCDCPPCKNEREKESIFYAYKCIMCDEAAPQVRNGPIGRAKCLECDWEGTIAHPNIVLETEATLAQAVSALELPISQNGLQGIVKALKEVLTKRAQVLYKFNRNLGQVQDAIARCLCTLGEFDSAYDYLLDSVNITRAIYGSTIELANELEKLSQVAIRCRAFRRCYQAADEAAKIFYKYFGECPSYEDAVQLMQLCEQHF